MDKERIFILGAGITGLAAGLASGLPVLEAADIPGGICASYYIRPGEQERLTRSPDDAEVYRFEPGGGHWIFGGDPAIRHFIRTLTPVKSYTRRASVYFRGKHLYVPYPLQYHLRFLPSDIKTNALVEMSHCSKVVRTMKEWLEHCFGQTLCEWFFYPFHELYTSSLYKQIAPQDVYKSPVELALVIQGAFQDTPAVGYNPTFRYPMNGLNRLIQGMADRCNVRYQKRVIQVDVETKELLFADGSRLNYDVLISTLALNKMLEMSGVIVDSEPDPYTSVLVLNIGAVRGDCCPDEHWLYMADAFPGFYRLGFYSNVDQSFLPHSARKKGDRASMYIERAYLGAAKPGDAEIELYTKAVIKELQDWGFIGDVEVVDATWIDIAYTWSLPNSLWKELALRALESHRIYQVGRYGRWQFQGIADSLKEGFFVGASFKEFV